ncbi:DUF5123 domain-containing protein [Bacteroides sp.]|uniref:DUF5123 domain-containing protein n=1 Tax=Bacteroides sp. TaxID=29523 RepID=UPI0025B88D6A|nr:DUF5123 domain-containing protein [Bacteroides sp.]
MKHIFNIKTLLLSLLLGVGTLITSCNDDDDVMKADALFRPIIGETTIGGQWIELEWDRYTGAERYVLTLAGKAVGQTDSLKMEVETDTTFYRFEGLEYDTDYLIKIKSIGNGLESKYYVVPTITTTDYPTKLKGVQAIDNKALVAWDDAGYTTLNLVQVVTSEGSTQSEEVEIANRALTNEEQVSRQVIFDNLEPSCNYIVRAYINGTYQGKKVFSTAAPEVFEGAVSNLRDIPEEEAYDMLTSSFYEDLVAEYPDQDITIVLAGGQKYEMTGLKLPATTGTIKLITGLSLKGNAIMEVASNYDIAGNVGGFIGEKISFIDHANAPKSSGNFGGTYLFNLSVSDTKIGTMKFVNCNIKYKRGICRIKTGADIDNFIIENCVIDSIGGYGITNADNGDADILNIKVTNSTFSHCEKLFVSTKPSAKLVNSFYAENCTFIYNMKIGDNYMFDFNKMKFSSDPTLKNCIFGPGGKDGKAGAISGYRGEGSLTVDNCFATKDITWFIAEGADAPSAPIEMNSTGADTNGTFENAANNNFKLLINDLKNVAGDPRWW